MIASIPLIASFPKMVDAAAVCSVSERPPKLLRKLSMTPFSVFMFPELSVRLIPYLSIASAMLLVGAAMLARDVFKAVPAMLPLIELLAISPNAKEVSSTLYFMAPATGATYLNDSPSMPTFVFELADAFARTSEKCPASFAFSPKAVKASVTISEVLARFSPEAAARLIIPDIPAVICSGFQPAIAM